MLEIRIHGRGGQGVVTAAELISVAAFREGRFSQAFPSFGSERMGAPVVSFCRIDEVAIRLREPVASPDVLIIQDATLFQSVNVLGGLQPGGYLLINSARSPHELGLDEIVARLPPGHVRCVPAAEIGRRHLGRPLANVALLGGFAALTGAVHLASVELAIRERFPGATGDKNVAAAEEAFAFASRAVAEEAAC